MTEGFEKLEPLLTTKSLGRAVVHLETTQSTNRDVRALATAGQPHGLLVVADEQTAGRGRLSHVWSSPPGVNLYFSFLLKPKVPNAVYPQIPILCALALHQALGGLYPQLRLSLKWPNDLWTEDGRKLSGILCEALPLPDRSMAVIAGIGVNVNAKLQDFPKELQGTATSLRLALGTAQSRGGVLAAFLNRFEKLWDEWETHPALTAWLDYWRQYDALLGRQITIEQDGRQLPGIAHGMDEEGHLRLKLESEDVVLIHAGDVHVSR